MNYQNLYEKLRLDELGIPSDEEAEELEYELDLRFEDFTPKDRRTWLQQNDYLEHFSRTGTLSSAAKKAGVTIYKAQRWQYNNALGFVRRHEVATLIFNDRLKQKALLRASDPNSPARLLIELLRAYIPEEFSRDNRKSDSSKSDELFRRLRENAGRELDAGLPTFRKMAEGAENAYPDDDRPTEPDVYEGEPVILDDLPTEPDVYQAEPVIPNDDSYPDPADVWSDDPTSPTRHSRESGNPQTVPASTQNPAPRTSIPTRAQRREQLRQQRKAEKKNTFPVKRF